MNRAILLALLLPAVLHAQVGAGSIQGGIRLAALEPKETNNIGEFESPLESTR